MKKPCMYIICLCLVILMPGCSTMESNPTPVSIEDETPSFDNGDRNSGILAFEGGHYIVTPHFRQRYNHMITLYSDRFSPPLKKDDGVGPGPGSSFIVSPQYMVYFLDMNQWRKAGL